MDSLPNRCFTGGRPTQADAASSGQPRRDRFSTARVERRAAWRHSGAHLAGAPLGDTPDCRRGRTVVRRRAPCEPTWQQLDQWASGPSQRREGLVCGPRADVDATSLPETLTTRNGRSLESVWLDVGAGTARTRARQSDREMVTPARSFRSHGSCRWRIVHGGRQEAGGPRPWPLRHATNGLARSPEASHSSTPAAAATTRGLQLVIGPGRVRPFDRPRTSMTFNGSTAEPVWPHDRRT